MTFEGLRRALERRAPGRWELYRKTSHSRERDTCRGISRIAERSEEGWAARWWEGNTEEPAAALRFAAASSAEMLAAAIEDAARLPAGGDPVPDLPARGRKSPAPEAPAPIEDPPDLGPALSAAISAASAGTSSLATLAIRVGVAHERIANANGLDVSQALTAADGVASAIATNTRETGKGKGSSAAARAAFRFDPARPDVERLARRLADASLLPLSGRAAPFRTGQWLLEPAVAAAVLAAVAPAFCGGRGPSWLSRETAASPGVRIVDDAGAEAAWDGEGVATRRMLLVESGEVVARLYDLRSGKAAGRPSTGHGARPSFREPPRCEPRKIFFEGSQPAAAESLLSSVRRGLVARALTAPVRVDLAGDRYEVEFTGVSVIAGREQNPVAGARASGRISELLRRIEGVGSDLQFFPMPFLAGSGTVLVGRAAFD